MIIRPFFPLCVPCVQLNKKKKMSFDGWCYDCAPLLISFSKRRRQGVAIPFRLYIPPALCSLQTFKPSNLQTGKIFPLQGRQRTLNLLCIFISLHTRNTQSARHLSFDFNSLTNDFFFFFRKIVEIACFLLVFILNLTLNLLPLFPLFLFRL